MRASVDCAGAKNHKVCNAGNRYRYSKVKGTGKQGHKASHGPKTSVNKLLHMKIKSKIARTAGAIAAALALLPATGSAQDMYYLYNGQRIPLTAVPGKVAVRSAAADPAEAQRALAAAAAVNVTDTQTLGIPGWTVVNLGASRSPAMRSLAAASASPALAAQSLASQAGVAYAVPVFTAGGEEVIPTGEILVKITDGADGTAVLAALRNANITGSAALGGNIFKLTTNLKDGVAVVQLANSLNGKPGIVSAEPNLIQSVKSNLVPTDPLFTQAWGLRNTGQDGGVADFDMGVTDAWDTTLGSSAVVVVVFECGIDPNHPDINATTGRDFTNQPVANAGPRPTGNEGADNHGTWVAGCISGRANNGIGATGVAPGVRIASARIGIPVGGGSFSADNSWIVSALDWAVTIGARVTNHSYSMGAPSSVIDSAFQRARNAGIIHMAATGNNSANTVGFPASSPYVVGVGAADRFGNRASFSNYGSGLDFMAPGLDIITTDRVGAMGGNSDNYATVSGTSFASPYAAGVAALIMSVNPTWTPAQVEQRMKETCTDMGAPGADSQTGSGLLNVFRALGGTTAPQDDHGDTIATATGVSIPSDTNGEIGASGDEDFFRFTLTRRMEVTAKTTSSIDTYGYLLDASGETLADNDDADGRYDFRIVAVLNPGTYYVRVRGYSTTTAGSYILNLEVRPLPAPEISITGNNVEIVSGDVTPSTDDGTAFGSLTSGTYVDRIFTVRNTGNADLRLTGGTPVAVSGATTQFRVTSQPASTIAAGGSSTFTVRFQPTASGTSIATLSIANTDSDESAYTFAINGSRSGSTDDHGNTMSTATLVGVPTSRAGILGTGGDLDFFRFTLATRTTVTVTTTGTTDTWGQLYNASGTLLTYDDDGAGYPNFRIVRTLAAGTYYVRVSGYSQTVTGAYTLRIIR